MGGLAARMQCGAMNGALCGHLLFELVACFTRVVGDESLGEPHSKLNEFGSKGSPKL